METRKLLEETRQRITHLETSLEVAKITEKRLMRQLEEERAGQKVFEFVQDKDDKTRL